jgi:hypothetical protein
VRHQLKHWMSLPKNDGVILIYLNTDPNATNNNHEQILMMASNAQCHL